MRDQKEPNIDDLLRVVTESVSAYKVCQERIDAVEKALQAALGADGAGHSQRDFTGTSPLSVRAGLHIAS
jgi:exodeoxyribonuclease VII small subunit